MLKTYGEQVTRIVIAMIQDDLCQERSPYKATEVLVVAMEIQMLTTNKPVHMFITHPRLGYGNSSFHLRV